jgi:iron complex transport system substrate-binding protein
MPIEYSLKIKLISEDDFHLLDYEVMGLAFSIHREMGRFWDEKIYRNELAYRCQKAGFETVATEVPIKVSYKDFNKLYYIDLLINDAVIYELKTVHSLIGEHKKQTLNYLFLVGLQHGKLINMRPASVEHSFVSTRITPDKRYNFTINDLEWKELDGESIWLKQMFISLLEEWGAFLDIQLFYDAIKHFRGGEENVVKKIEVVNGSNVLGNQKVHLISPEIAFKITSVTKREMFFEQHLRRFIHFTAFRAIQWINFNHDRIVFKAILP